MTSDGCHGNGVGRQVRVAVKAACGHSAAPRTDRVTSRSPWQPMTPAGPPKHLRCRLIGCRLIRECQLSYTASSRIRARQRAWSPPTMSQNTCMSNRTVSWLKTLNIDDKRNAEVWTLHFSFYAFVLVVLLISANCMRPTHTALRLRYMDTVSRRQS